MLRAVIIDDEVSNISSLSEKLNKHIPEVQIVARADNARDGAGAIESLRPDIVFLDIEMPVVNGFTMLQHLSYRDFELVFVTAYDHYAIQAIRYSALDYLVKPVEIEELKQAVARAAKNSLSRKTNTQVNILMEHLLRKPVRRLAVPSSDGLLFIPFEDIEYLIADNNYTNIVLTNHQKILASKTMKDFEEMLPPDMFVRIHHSHMINNTHVLRYIRGDGGQVVMKAGVVLDVSKRKKSEVLRALGYKGSD